MPTCPPNNNTMSSKDTIHDLLSIGEIEAALSSNQEKEAEIDRLPLLLRLLATGQPLSAVPHLMPNTPSPRQNTDPLINAVVSKLEDVAATHSAAESIDVLVTHIAPSISRRISKLGPLKRTTPDEWSTSDLAATARAPLANLRGKKTRLSVDQVYSGESDDNLGDGSGDEMEDTSDNAKLQEQEQHLREKYGKSQRMRSEGRESLLAGMQEDSQEAHLTRILSEVASLVVESLQPPPPAPKEEHEEAPPELLLSVKADSLLSESDATMGGGNDLGACLSALMHHAPVLRHRHVASAFCRASVPQSATLIYRMGANSPNAVACLVRGCMDAVAEGATESTVATAKEAVRRLAKLSPREATRIRGMLQLAMLDVQLELALEQDSVAAACLLTRYLATGESLKDLLQANTTLVSKCYECLLARIEALEKPAGEVKLYLRALAWLICSAHVGNAKILVAASTTLAVKLTWLCNEGLEIKPETSDKDAVFGLVLSSSLVLCSLLALSGGQEAADGVTRKDAWQHLLKTLLACNPPSTRAEVLLSRVAALLHSQELSRLQELVKEALSSQEASLNATGLQDGFTKLCKWAVINGNLDTLCNRSLTHTAVVLDPSALLQMVVANNIEAAKLESLMRGILMDADCAAKFIQHGRVCDLLTAVISFLSKNDRQAFPLVSEKALSALIRTALSTVGSEVAEPEVLQMALNFTYTVLFFDENPASPFSFDPREQPVAEVLQLIKNKGLEEAHDRIRSILQKYSPEIIYESDSLNPAMTTLLEISNESNLKHQDILKMLSRALRNTLKSPDVDPSGLNVERTFLLAQRHIPFSQVDCLVVRSLIGLPNSPAPFFTYGTLCKDPLLLLQCPVSVWQCRGMRRVALSVLGRLLPANENLARQSSPSEDVADELITSRNVVLLRCLLCLASGYTLSEDTNSSSLTKPCQCHVLTGMIRSLVSNQTGLVAILIKHGLPDEVVDWLVDFVPECINDAFALMILLSERSPLTAAERLKTADAALRIAIAFGSRDEMEAKNLASACLHQLVSSFYLVLGPVGVPVNALIEESGMDLTQVCRQATFRILSALQKVRFSRTGLKSECALALQKLASLCKGESGMTGVAGAVANRRKALLKEIWDALVKALNEMGSGVNLN